MSLQKNTCLKIVTSSIITFTFLYSQVIWAAGYELFNYTLDEETLRTSFKSPEEAVSIDAKKQFLAKRQIEIDGARRIGLNWQYPLHEPNKELRRNLYYQQINSTRALIEGKRYADETTGRIGAYGKYYIKHKDDMVTWYFNALLTDIIGEKVKDKIGHTSIQDTIEMLYNEKRQLTSFRQKTTDERSNVTTKIWDSAAYWAKEDSLLDYKKGKNLLAGYHEQTTYPTGEVIDRSVANLTYYTLPDQNVDSSRMEEQIASYDETKTSNQSPDASSNSHWYNSTYLKRPFTYTSLDPFDEEKYPDPDDRYDYLLTGFKEDSTTLDVTTTRVWSNPVYNEHEQITSYHESIDSLGFHTERGFYDAEYDSWGRLTSYRETIDTEGLVTDRYWHDGEYNNIDQLIYYKEDLFSGGVWTYTTWDSPAYNAIGQLVSYHTVTESGGIEIDTLRSGIIYNSYGLPSSYDEVVTSLSMTITTNRRNITYESHGWTVGWEDTIREQAGYVDVAGRVVNIDRIYTLKRYDMGYYWNGLVSVYRELLTDPLGIITLTYRYDIEYNNQGFLISYIEEILKTGLGMDITIKTIRDSINYNMYGQMTDYHETMVTSETPGLTTETTRSGIRYSNEGWITEYTETVQKYASSRPLYDTTTTTRRYDIVYNLIGKPTKYKEETTNELGTKVSKEWRDGKYNSVGLLTNFYEKTTYPDRIIETQQYEILYDEFDRIIGYKEKDTDQFGIVTETTRKDIKYIGQNVTQYHEDIIRGSQRWAKDWFSALYNSKNQLLGYKERAADPFNVTTDLVMSGMGYSLFGQLIGYNSKTDRDLDYTNTRTWSGSYNSLNQLYLYTETSTTTDGILNLRAETKRLSTKYNSLGYVTDYKEEAKDLSASPDKTTEKTRSNAAYGDKGVLLSYTEEETALGVTKKTEKTGITYNSIGQETDYAERITETNQIDKVITNTHTGIVYYDDGRLKEYTEAYNETGLNLNYLKTTFRNSITYDSIGNQLGYEDRITESSAPDYTTIVKWSGTYNSLGLQTSTREETKKGERPKVVVIRNDINYRENGLQDSYYEETTDFATPDKTVTKLWEAGLYDNYGRLVEYTEIIDEDLATERIVTRTGIGYANNLLTNYTEEVTDFITPDKTVTNTWSAAYNTLGQLNSYAQESTETGVSVDWDKTITQTRLEITYDSQGREYGYTNTETDSSKPNLIIITTRLSTGYNGNGLASSYSETQNYKGGAGSGMDYAIEKERTNVQYNVNEQIISYIEEQINSTSPDKTTTMQWSASGYNSLGQLTGDTTITEETDSAAITEIRTNIEYNEKNQLTNYTKAKESTAASDLLVTTVWEGSYNDLGLLINYTEEETSVDKTTNGAVYNVVRRTERDTTYNSGGLVTQYQETVTGNTTTETTMTVDSYDNLGQITAYTEITRETAAGLDVEKIKRRSAITYLNGNVIDYTERVTDNITPNKITDTTWEGAYNNQGQLSTYSQTSQETGTDTYGNSIDSITAQAQSGITYNSFGQIVGYTSITEYPSGLIETITRTGIQYNDLGQVLYYYEQIERSDQPGIFTTHTFSDATYDKSGNLLTYDDITIDAYGSEVKEKMSDVEYNEGGQITSYHMESTQYGITTITEWSGGEYNSDGQLIRFHEENTILGVLTVRDWQGALYNDDGRIIYYTETRTETPGRTYNIIWKDAEYDEDGNLVRFTEETTDGGLLTTKTRSGATYTSNGLILGYTETITETGTGLNATTTRAWTTTEEDYDDRYRILAYTETIIENGITTDTTWTALGYTDNDQITGYREVSITNGVTATITRTGVTYNNNGELTGYIDTIVNSNTPDLVTTIIRSNEVYELGQLISYIETTRYYGISLDQTITVNRSNATYDDGRETGYTETIQDTIATGLTQTITMSAEVYNSLGQLTGYMQTIRSQGTGLDTTETATVSGLTYNTKGQETGYTETQTNTAVSGLTLTKTIFGKTYDLLGQLDTYTKTERLQGIGLDQTITTTRTDTTYTNGLETGFAETIIDTSQSSLTKEITRSAEAYNTFGQLIGFTEVRETYKTTNKNKLDMTLTIVRESDFTTYNSNGLLTGYKDTITDSTASNLQKTITATGYTYNELGQINGYVENVFYEDTYEDPDDDPYELTIDKVFSDITYNAKNQETGYIETITRSDEENIEYTVTIGDKTYNTLGQLEGFAKTFVEYSTLLDLSTTTELVQSSRAYNSVNQLTGYNQDIMDPDGTYSSNYRDAVYNDLDQIDSYRNETTDYDGILTETDFSDPEYNDNNQLNEYKIVKETEGVITEIEWDRGTYNELGQLTRYREKTEIDGDDEPTVNWTGITFEDKGQYVDFHSDIIQGPNTTTLADILSEDIEKIHTQDVQKEESGEIINLFSVINGLLSILLKNNSLIQSVTTGLKIIDIEPFRFVTDVYYNTLMGYSGLTPQALQEKTRFFEELPTDEGLGLKITSRLETEYNPIDQITSYSELVTQIGGTWSPIGELITTTQQKTVTREDITYNIFGQVTDFSETEINDQGVEKTTERSNIVYTELGLVEDYEEKRLELGIEKDEDVSNLTYNENGQLVAFHSILKEQAVTYTADSMPIRYEMTTITERLSTEYEKGQMTGLKETVWNSSTSGLTTTTEKSDISYNLYGQVAGLIEKISTPFETVTSMKSNLSYTPGGNLLSFHEQITSTIAPDLVTIRNWSGATYSPRGELKGYIERVKTQDLIREIRKAGITYDILGRVLGYKLIEKDFGTRTTIRQNITYNLLHQMLGYEEITDRGRILFTGAEYDLTGKLLKFTKETTEKGQPTTTQQRLNTVYNDYGQIISYDDKITKLAMTQLLNVNLNYNTFGQTLGYVQTTHTTGGPLDYTETTTRSGSLYDTYGRLASYDETDSSTAKHVSLTYNTKDQLTNYTEQGQKYGDNYTYTKASMQYDTLNRITSYIETNIGVAEQSSASISLIYNDLNQITNRTEQGTDRKGGYSIDTTDIQYNDIGQQTSFIQSKTQNNLTETTTRTDTTYNSVGLTLGYSETSVIASGAKQSRLVSSLTYDNRGRTYGFTEAGTSEDGSTYTLTRSDTKYDSRQRINGYKEQGWIQGQGRYNYIKTDITYDQLNRTSGYTENGWREASGSYNTNRNSILYDTQDRVTEFRENGWAQGQGSYTLHRYAINYKLSTINSYTEQGWQEGKGTYKTERSQMQYTNNKLTSLHEKISSSDGSQLEFDRTNIAYNSDGQIVSYSESGTRKGQGTYTLTKSAITYNSIGQVTEFKESGTNSDGSYSYHRYAINYQLSTISSYEEQGTDTKGKGYSMSRHNMNYDGSGRLVSYNENSNEGSRTIYNMSYNENGQLVNQNVRTDKDNFQFGGHSTYAFSYDGNGNLSQTRIDTPDYWVTFDGKGNQTGTGLSAQMQNYINDLQRQAEEAEREAEHEMRSAEDKINEAIEAERRAMEEEATNETVTIITEPKTKKEKKLYKEMKKYESRGWKERAEQAKQKLIQAQQKRVDAQSRINETKIKAEEAKKKAREQTDRARSQADRAKGKAEESKQQAGRVRELASAKATNAKQKAEQAKQTARISKEKADKVVKTTEPRIQVTKTKNADGSTTVVLTDRISGSRRELIFDSFGDMTYKQAKNSKGEITHLETHNYTRDGQGRISGDTYHKEVTSPEAARRDSSGVGTGTSRQTRDRITEDGKIEYNKYGQVTSADITRQVKTELSRGPVIASETKQSRGWKEIANYTMEIKLTTTQDSQGRVVSESESTHIFGKEAIQTKSGSYKTEQVDYTINRDRNYSYDGNSVLPSGWHEKVTQSNMDLVIETDVWDIKYDDKGRMQDYRGKTHEYGSYIDEKGKKQTIDVIREFHRHDITYNDKNQMTSYREERWSSDKPGLIQFAYVYDIQYNSAGLMTSYMEVLREVGYVSLEGVPKGLAPPSFGLEETMQVIAELASGKSELLSQYYLVDKTTITHRTGITYNSLNQITGYTDQITNPDQTTTTVQMTGISYWSDGRMKGYSQTTTGPDDEGKIKTHTTNIYNTEYDRLGRIDEKYGTYDGKKYKWQAISYDELGRPTAYKEKYGKVSSKHYDIIYNELGDVAYEKIKVTAKSGTGIFSSKTKILTEYWYGYNDHGVIGKIKENEIYRKVSTNSLGQIVKAVVGIAAFIIGGPIVAALVNVAFNILSGADLGQALLGAAISLAASYIGAQIGSLVSTGAFATNVFAPIGLDAFLSNPLSIATEILGLVDQLIVDDQGKGLFEQIFGEWGGVILGGIQILGGLLGSGLGNKSPPTGYDIASALGKILIQAGVTALGDKVNPYLRQFILGFTSSFLSSWASGMDEQTKIKQVLGNNAPEGYIKVKEIKDTQGNITGFEVSSLDGQFKAELTTNLKLKSITSQDGNLTRFDEEGMPVYTKLTNGDIIAYDISGKEMAYIKQGTEPIWENGKITKTYLETDAGKEYYTTKGEFEALVPEENEPFYNADNRITGSYIEQNGITNIYNEKGQLDSSITPAIGNGKVQGYYIDIGNTTTYTDSQGVPIWYQNTATPNSSVYFYDPFDQSISGQLLTRLDENSLIQGYIYQDFQKNEYTLYDKDGNQIFPTINPRETTKFAFGLSHDILQRIGNAIQYKIESAKAIIKSGISRLSDGAFLVDIRGPPEINKDPILSYLQLVLAIYDPTAGIARTVLDGITSLDNRARDNLTQEIVRNGKVISLLEKLIPLIQNIPQGLSNITDNLLDLIITPAFANNGEVQAQALQSLLIEPKPTLIDRLLNPIRRMGEEYTDRVKESIDLAKTLWGKWSNFITPDYNDNTSILANFGNEIFNANPIKNAEKFYLDNWVDLVTPDYSDNTSTWTNFWNEIVNGDSLRIAGNYYLEPLVEAKNDLINGANKIINSTKATVNTIKEFGNYLKDEFKTGVSEVTGLWNGVNEQYKKVSNFYYGFGFRTDEQITQEKALEVMAAKTVGRSGDIVSASGDEWWAFYVKAGEMTGVGDKNLDIVTAGAKYLIAMANRLFSDNVNKPIPNHTGMLIRKGDEIYVMEINPGYFRVIPIEKFAKNYKDITIMRPSNEKTEKIANTMFDKLFNRETLQAKTGTPNYNTLGLLGISNIDSLANKNSAICSEWVYQGFNEYSKIVEGATNPIGVIGRDNRISPYDIDYTSPLWDENILDIYYSEYPDQSGRK